MVINNETNEAIYWHPFTLNQPLKEFSLFIEVLQSPDAQGQPIFLSSDLKKVEFDREDKSSEVNTYIAKVKLQNFASVDKSIMVCFHCFTFDSQSYFFSMCVFSFTIFVLRFLSHKNQVLKFLLKSVHFPMTMTIILQSVMSFPKSTPKHNVIFSTFVIVHSFTSFSLDICVNVPFVVCL
jgi:hypothetical protein